jgi:hypothetical protein
MDSWTIVLVGVKIVKNRNSMLDDHQLVECSCWKQQQMERN